MGVGKAASTFAVTVASTSGVGVVIIVIQPSRLNKLSPSNNKTGLKPFFVPFPHIRTFYHEIRGLNIGVKIAVKLSVSSWLRPRSRCRWNTGSRDSWARVSERGCWRDTAAQGPMRYLNAYIVTKGV